MRPSKRGRCLSPTKATFGETLERCPFRTLIGIGSWSGSMDALLANALPKLAYTVAVLGGDPEPINSETMAEIVTSIQAGRCVLLISDRADLRDYAKREILAMALPAEGRA